MTDRGWRLARALLGVCAWLLLQGCDPELSETGPDDEVTAAQDALLEDATEEEEALKDKHCDGVVRARVVAIDQPYTYNRFGAFNPFGQIYALERDVVPAEGHGAIGPGNARLRADKRPRPLVLRVNKRQCLEIIFTNLLSPDRHGGHPPEPDPGHEEDPEDPGHGGGDKPATRFASIHVMGLNYLNIESDGANVGRNPSSLAAPGQTRVYLFKADREGVFP
ncbi:MAG: hypothetical protein ACK4N5_00205, partial [Myxococcales bacterium]